VRVASGGGCPTQRDRDCRKQLAGKDYWIVDSNRKITTNG